MEVLSTISKAIVLLLQWILKSQINCWVLKHCHIKWYIVSSSLPQKVQMVLFIISILYITVFDVLFWPVSSVIYNLYRLWMTMCKWISTQTFAHSLWPVGFVTYTLFKISYISLDRLFVHIYIFLKYFVGYGVHIYYYFFQNVYF